MLQNDPKAVLVDVRSRPEWQFVGIPDLSSLNKDALLIEWQSYPTMQVNGDFTRALKASLSDNQIPDDAPLLFLCRSGVRSQAAAAAMSAEGHTRCYNISGGFERAAGMGSAIGARWRDGRHYAFPGHRISPFFLFSYQHRSCP